MKKFITGFLFISIFASNAIAVNKNRAFMGNALDENKQFIEFINVHVTNFGNEEMKKLYHEAAAFNFESESFYLAGEYDKSFERLINCHKKLRQLYYKILTEKYEKDTEELLKMSTTIILIAKDKTAEHSLRMGYDLLAKGVYKRKYGFSVSKHMLSKKIKIYMEAINLIIKAKRYAIIALVESTIPLIDKKEYRTQTFDEAKKNIEKIDIPQYEYLRNEIINNLNKKTLPEGYPFLLHHDDNYGQIGNGQRSELNIIGDELNKKAKTYQKTENPQSQDTSTQETPAGETKTPEKTE